MRVWGYEIVSESIADRHLGFTELDSSFDKFMGFFGYLRILNLLGAQKRLLAKWNYDSGTRRQMRFILRLKHWQLFFLAIGLPILADFFDVSKHGQTGTIDIIVVVVTVSTVFGWIWTIGNELHKLLPIGQNFKLWGFRTAFTSALTLLVFIFWATENETIMASDDFLILLFAGVPIYLGLMIYVVLYAAKTLKTIELGRLAKIDEYAGEAFLIWMVPLGVWFIQPRLNRLTE